MRESTTIASDLQQARRLEEHLIEAVMRQGFAEEDVFAIKLALEEALVNAIRHGNAFDPDKRVHVCAEITPQQACFAVTDEGPGFRLDDVPDPTADENLQRPCGRGLMLIRAYMDEVSFNETGNEITMVKRKG